MEVIYSKTLADAYLKAYQYVMWNHDVVDTEDGELTYESKPLTLVVDEPNKDKSNVKMVSPYNDNFLKSYEDQLINGSLNDFDYTYNERLFKYEGGVNQIQMIINRVMKQVNSRRAVAITWYPKQDNCGGMSVPCLQYIQCKLRNKKLDMYTMWRSRDILMGMPANMFAMNTLHNYIVEQLNNNGLEAKVGKYIDVTFIPHVYFKRDANYCAAMESHF